MTFLLVKVTTPFLFQLIKGHLYHAHSPSAIFCPSL